MGSLKENDSICFEILEFLETVVDCDRSGLLIVHFKSGPNTYLSSNPKVLQDHPGGSLFGSLDQVHPINIY